MSTHELIVRIAQKWQGHKDVNFESTTDENLLLLIEDAIDGDQQTIENLQQEIELNANIN